MRTQALNPGADTLAVLGDPVAHSLSPVMHNSAFALKEMNAVYLALRVEAPQLSAALSGARAMGFRGVNLTVPHKEAALPLLDQVDDRAARMGAVNTVAFGPDGRAVGYNTDGPGFLWSLRELGDFSPAGCRALVAGAGGAARAVVAALAEAGAERVDVVNRTHERAEAMLFDLARADFAHLGQALDSRGAAEALRRADLVVNCTTRGMWPDVEGMPPLDPAGMAAGALAVDVVYRPRPTRWLAEAARHGCRTLDGLGMLAGQAAAAWEVWFGETGPALAMLAAAEQALAARGS
ncbi:MAG: shikimate dehydrogenase [Bacillota bacterium]